MKFLAAAAVLVSLVGATASAAPAPQLELPLDLESSGRVLYIADAGRDQILRYDLRTRKLAVLAGTGVTGFGGDGGPARRARLDEVAGLALDRAGNVYVADLGNGRVRRIARNGVITTVARVTAVVALSVDPSGRWLAIASIENRIHRLELATGTLEVLTEADNPHGLAYEADGDLLIAEQNAVRRLDAGTGRLDTVRSGPAFKLEVAPNGAVYLLNGSPSGGTVDRLEPSGRLVRVAGTGKLTPHRATQPALRAGVLPADLEVLADGTILLAQTKPVPAIRRIARGSLTTILR